VLSCGAGWPVLPGAGPRMPLACEALGTGHSLFCFALGWGYCLCMAALWQRQQPGAERSAAL